MDSSSEDEENGETWPSKAFSSNLQKLPPTNKTPKKKDSKAPRAPRIHKKSKDLKTKTLKEKVAKKLFDYDAHDYDAHDCTESRSNAGTGGSGGGSSGKWLDKITPKKHWTCIHIQDLGSVNATCQMCERERIRYVHTMSHKDYVDELRVGCICAGHLSGDTGLSKERQAKLEQRLKRRENFPKLRNWKISRNQNDYIVFQRKGKQYWVVITRPRGEYSAMIEDKSANGKKKFINKFCKSKEEAMIAAFDHLFPPKLNFEEGEQDFDFGYDEM